MDPNRAEISCRGKAKLTANRAKQVAQQMRRADKGEVGPYKCKHCGAWHIGSRLTDAPRKRTKNHGQEGFNYGNDEA